MLDHCVSIMTPSRCIALLLGCLQEGEEEEGGEEEVAGLLGSGAGKSDAEGRQSV